MINAVWPTNPEATDAPISIEFAFEGISGLAEIFILTLQQGMEPRTLVDILLSNPLPGSEQDSGEVVVPAGTYNFPAGLWEVTFTLSVDLRASVLEETMVRTLADAKEYALGSVVNSSVDAGLGENAGDVLTQLRPVLDNWVEAPKGYRLLHGVGSAGKCIFTVSHFFHDLESVSGVYDTLDKYGEDHLSLMGLFLTSLKYSGVVSTDDPSEELFSNAVVPAGVYLWQDPVFAGHLVRFEVTEELSLREVNRVLLSLSQESEVVTESLMENALAVGISSSPGKLLTGIGAVVLTKYIEEISA